MKTKGCDEIWQIMLAFVAVELQLLYVCEMENALEVTKHCEKK